MRVLTVDVGNTTVDLCLFEEDTPRYIGRFDHSSGFSSLPEFDLAVVLSVKSSLNRELEARMHRKVVFISREDIPLESDYKTPQTLGTDRLLFAYGVREFYSKDAVLVSAGTALVVDLLLDGVFRGGFITAGLSSKLSCLSSKAEGIPSLTPEALSIAVGRATSECVLGGVYLESLTFVKETAKRWTEIYRRKLPIFLTGGDGYLFRELGVYDPLILHRAMHRIIING